MVNVVIREVSVIVLDIYFLMESLAQRWSTVSGPSRRVFSPLLIDLMSQFTSTSPFTRLGMFRIGGRSTAIRLASGDVWVLASTPLTAETKATIDHLGPVKFVVGPNAVHHLFLGKSVLEIKRLILIHPFKPNFTTLIPMLSYSPLRRRSRKRGTRI